MKLLWSNLSLGGLYTDVDTDDDDNDTQWTEHGCIGSLPNEPKSTKIQPFEHHHGDNSLTPIPQ